MKDEYNALLPQRQPGFLTDTLGGRVEQYYALDKDAPLTGTWGTGEASVWAEQLKSAAPDGDVLLRYGTSNGWLDDQPAVITRAVGKGRITYIGTILDEKLMTSAANCMAKQAGITPAFGSIPDGIEVSRRVGDEKQVFVLINFAQEKQKVTLPRSMLSVLDGTRITSVELAQYGVAVLQDSKLTQP
jgi:beta-galactosidase